MARVVLGARIRERRRSLGLTQAELARRIGISASYINLIERNKRGIAGPLLAKTATALDLSLDDLDGAAERRLLETLEEVAHLPSIGALGVEANEAGELLGRFPGWARALVALARAEREASGVARELADRMTHDPFLGESVHRMLTGVAAVRSAAEILVSYEDIEPARRERFHQIVHEESRGLSEVGEALAGYFDKALEADRSLTPLDEVESLFEAHANRFDNIETAAQALAGKLIDATPGPRDAKAAALASTALTPVINRFIADQSTLESSPAKSRAHEALLRYGTDAILAPLETFAPLAHSLKYDVEGLASALSLSIEAACRRLTALPAGEGVPRFGYFQVNAAGTLVEARSLPGLIAPRHASACPLWVLYRAQQSPESVIRQRALFPSGERFVFLARARSTGATGFGKPRHYLTDMLVVTEEDSNLTVYAPERGVPVEEVGPACRICPRARCAHRIADPLSG
ncbi:MAG: short-chain fatty acyl-CoA regulator family protein [Gammaproteobacteria bacterium]|nr:short-chain fatty acyl-CoA regulator family protein [Gammaproteobacteria bacterium]